MTQLSARSSLSALLDDPVNATCELEPSVAGHGDRLDRQDAAIAHASDDEVVDNALMLFLLALRVLHGPAHTEDFLELVFRGRCIPGQDHSQSCGRCTSASCTCIPTGRRPSNDSQEEET